MDWRFYFLYEMLNVPTVFEKASHEFQKLSKASDLQNWCFSLVEFDNMISISGFSSLEFSFFWNGASPIWKSWFCQDFVDIGSHDQSVVTIGNDDHMSSVDRHTIFLNNQQKSWSVVAVYVCQWWPFHKISEMPSSTIVNIVKFSLLWRFSV